MKIRKLAKALLLIFVVLSFTVLIYKEFSPKSESNVTAVTATQGDKTSVPKQSLPVPESQPSKEPATKQKQETPSPLTEVKSQNSKVIAYYFHGTFRCSTCRTIEQYSHDAIQTYFAKELGNGTLEFRPLNVEEPENKHFIQDYQLVTRSLVLSLVSDGKETKWKNLPDVWKLVRDKDKFFQYVKDEVDKFLKET
ncbi:MAG: nitrophenyl compound nitroreductase subunit ArsF family protein [Thermodesulfovibrionales bacterium]